MKQDLKLVLRWAPAARATLNRVSKDIRLELVLAIIWQESSGNPWAYNPEQKYRWFWNVKIDRPFRKVTDAEIASEFPPADFPTIAGDRDQEWWAQQASWGLLQLMGAAGREQGFKGEYLTELTEPYVNLEYGIKHLYNYAFQYGNRSTEQALGRWNRNPSYPGEVLEKVLLIERAL